MNTSQKNGLPDIAEDIRSNKKLMIVLFIIVSIIIGSMWLYKKKHQDQTKIADEVYTIPSDQKFNQLDKTLSSTEIKNVNTQPSVNPEIIQQQLAFIDEKKKELQLRLQAPLMIVNMNTTPTKAQEPSAKNSSDANTQFMNQVSKQGVEVAIANTIGPLNRVIAEGSLIHAILESATNSDLPGNLRASISEPVYSEDGSEVLLPRGSRLIGQYKSGILQGQSRIFVVWTRVITPSGVSVQLGSLGVDSLGVSGMGADEVNRHFWERFSNAALLSLIGAGASNVGVNGSDQNNSSASYREAVASSFAHSADQSLQQDNRIAPTLQSYQGKPIIVFVAKDLHFESVRSFHQPKVNIF